MTEQSCFELFGVECGDGWKSIYEPLLVRARKEGATVAQVKEKFGGLRFYVSGASDGLRELIREAEGLSFETCEVCGQPGEPRRGGGIKTLCDAHARKSK